MNFSAGPDLAGVIPHKAIVTSLSYHEDGIHLFAATQADSRLYLINSQTGTCTHHPFRCEREGISTVSSTHHDQCVLISGGKSANAIHYWSLYDNKILRKYRGHAGRVTDVSMNPTEDSFLTASEDRTVRLWNIQQAGCIGQMNLPSDTKGQPRVVFDSTGLVFGVTAEMAGGQGNYLHLYDARNYTAGAFAELKVSNSDLQKAMTTQRIALPPEPMTWQSLQFNMSGNRLLVRTEKYGIVLDGYEGTIQRIFPCDDSKAMCFTPDDQSVVIGNKNGTVDCWNLVSGNLVSKLEGHTGPVGAIACNPKYKQIASACKSTCLWIW